jgi:hypothetical protein
MSTPDRPTSKREGPSRSPTRKKIRAKATGNHRAWWVGGVVSFGVLAAITPPVGAESMAPVLVCSTGPSGQRFRVGVTMPNRADAGSVYTIRIDGADSGKVTHLGLNYIHDMVVDYAFPAGAYVDGSAQFVAGTGTANVIVGASVSYGAGVLEMVLPAKVQDGSSYTPPSVQFQLRAIGAPGSGAAVSFSGFRLKANAIVVGDVDVSCEPTPKPYLLGTTLVATAVQ